ncbi:DUF456 domain-containing protein [Cohnella herbarum]|uniref:DUF456 domain-containing protein n=1 Tax=Cohnella herbarum TaxID=2728023 RepID=A0A7Z2ZMH1_9BACL|nr:DUF456 domain-containing protein [Cohnella herbarum]QJD84845.1 DUF456 domain-containing protein [Cohnella herbarum]
MLRSKWGLASVIVGYVAGLVSDIFLPVAVALIFPVLGTMLGSVIRQAELKAAKRSAERDAAIAAAAVEAATSNQRVDQPNSAGHRIAEASSQSSSSQPSSSHPDRGHAHRASNLGPEWDSVMEYIGTIEDMVLIEGEKNNLDNEIVQRTLSLLVRLNRIIPQLVEFNNGDINHKIQRLVLRDLNGTITPFLNLSGEAKRQNRRILLNSLKDIDNQITTYTSFIEQKDLMELKNKAELIHQRYGAGN